MIRYIKRRGKLKLMSASFGGILSAGAAIVVQAWRWACSWMIPPRDPRC